MAVPFAELHGRFKGRDPIQPDALALLYTYFSCVSPAPQRQGVSFCNRPRFVFVFLDQARASMLDTKRVGLWWPPMGNRSSIFRGQRHDLLKGRILGGVLFGRGRRRSRLTFGFALPRFLQFLNGDEFVTMLCNDC